MHANPIYLLLIFVASIIAGLMIAIAGGGKLVVFPALLFAGVPPIIANATCALGLWPSAAASSWVYRRYIETPRRTLVMLLLVSIAGGFLGAWALLHTPEDVFKRLIPPLLLFAATLFTISGQVRRLAERISTSAGGLVAMAGVGQFAIAVYGGYFGAGMGVLMLSLFSLTLNSKIHSMNGVRTLCGTAVIACAVVVFILGHQIDWLFGGVVAAGTVLGATVGALRMRKMNPVIARRIVLVLVWGMTLAYVVKMGI